MAGTGIKKGLALIMGANFINLVISLVNGFVLPKYLSIECYALIKTYTLYSTYSGFFHLGYLDGMYLKYGGRDMLSVSSKEYGTDFWNITFIQVVVCVLLLIFGVVLNDFVLGAFAVGLLLRNITSCFQMFFQATGEFKLYSSALNYGTILSFVISLILVFAIKTDNARLYIGAQIFSSLVITIYLTFMLNNKISFISKVMISAKAVKGNVSQGFVLMVGNFSNNLFTSIDRWFVKILMSTFHFAAYSFAVSIDSLITVFITPLYVTLYNTFCKDHSDARILHIKRLVLMWGCAVVTLAFPAKFVIERYLTKYESSQSLMFVLFSTQIFYAIIKGVYVNYFKALQKQKQYFWQIVEMVIWAIALSLIFYFTSKSMMSLALAALMTSVIWLIKNELLFKNLRFRLADWLYLSTLVVVYLLCGLYLPCIEGCLVYIASLSIMSFFLMKHQTKEIINLIKSNIHL